MFFFDWDDDCEKVLLCMFAPLGSKEGQYLSISPLTI
ncbi:hypothetical protein VAA_00305 [Vibrio anguillarum 775]|nr:hypothetical protein VAA_00305 [Vibrio anguillarum 775]